MKSLNKKEIKKFFKRKFKRPQEIVILLENIQYAKNVANFFRLADAAGVSKVYLTGVTKTPPFGKDLRQTSRAAEDSVSWVHKETSGLALNSLRKQGYYVIAVEITDDAIPLEELKSKVGKYNKICFVFGSETHGVSKSALEKCNLSVFIPMYGKGASMNVSHSGAVVLYTI